MIQVGSKVRVFRPGQFELRGVVVAVDPIQFGRRTMVKVRPDPEQVTVVAAPGELDQWVEMVRTPRLKPGACGSPRPAFQVRSPRWLLNQPI